MRKLFLIFTYFYVYINRRHSIYKLVSIDNLCGMINKKKLTFAELIRQNLLK